MRKYRLTNRGKLVIAMLFTLIIASISLGISSSKQDIPEYYDYSEPKDNSQQQAAAPEPAALSDKEPEPAELSKAVVYFDANMTSFDKEYQNILDVFSAEALKHNSIRIRVEGNCATLFPRNSKQKSVNYDISLLRAQSVADYLQGKGINADRLVVVSNGSDKPIKDNSTPEGRRLNRRVDVYFINK